MINLKHGYHALILFFLVSLVLYYFFKIDSSSFLMPFDDSYVRGDGRMTIAYVKFVASGDWSSLIVPKTSHLSAPFHFEMYDYPLPFFSNFVYIKFLSVFSSDGVVVFNLYYISTYFLNAFTMFWVLRRLRVNVYLAISIGILFTFLPWHYLRLTHTFWSGYFFIPVWIYYLLLLTNKKPLFFKKKLGESKYSFDWSKRNIIIILVLVVSSTWNFYYTFFFSFLIGFTLLSNFIYRNSKHHILSTLIFFSLAIAPFAANMLPYKAYENENGKNYQVGQRQPIASEVFGLKIAHLLIPVEGHRIKSFASLKSSYNESNDILFKVPKHGASLGIVGGIGFLLLILNLIYKRLAPSILLRLSQFNITILLLSTIGGFSAIIAYTVTAQIRSYNRASIFIATLSLLAIALVINRYIKKKFDKKIIFFIVSLLILVVGIFDQIPEKYQLKANQESKTEYLSDKNFIQQIESKFDVDNEKIMIAQYPYITYPESGGVHNMKDYWHVQGYIHSDKLYWSFGAIKGRKADIWWKGLNEKSIEEQIQTLQEAGFSGIMINRNGYKDNAEGLENKLIQLLGAKPMVSDNKVLLFFEIISKGNKVILPPVFNSFYEWEGEQGKFRWAGDNAYISLFNDQGSSKTKSISFTLGTLRDRGMMIKLNGQTLEQFEMQSGLVTNHSYSLQLKPGQNTLKFETMEPARSPGGADNRKLAFNIGEFVLGGHAK